MLEIKKFFRYINASIQTMLLAPKQKAKRLAVKMMEAALILKYPLPQTGPLVDFPQYDEILAERRKNFVTYIQSVEYKTAPYKAVVIGDSIGQGASEWMLSIPKLMNFAKAGFWIHHMKQMYLDMRVLWRAHNFEPDVFFLETPGGNNLLQRQEVNYTIQQFIEYLNMVRADYPKARIIIGDLPATIVNYVVMCKPAVTQALIDWVNTDHNACLLCFIKHYVAKNKILPKNEESLEGVHFTPLGYVTLDNEVARAIQNTSLKIMP